MESSAGIIDQGWYLITKDLLTVALTGIGLWIAASGLVTWRKQIKGAKEFETAYGLNAATLKLRDAIRHVRNPWIPNSESERALRYSKEKYPDRPEDDLAKDNHSSVYEMRWEKILAAYAEVESLLFAAEFLWGDHILELFKPLTKKVHELNLSLSENFRKAEHRSRDPKEIREIMYDHGSEESPDKFSREISGLVNSITSYLKERIGIIT